MSEKLLKFYNKDVVMGAVNDVIKIFIQFHINLISYSEEEINEVFNSEGRVFGPKETYLVCLRLLLGHFQRALLQIGDAIKEPASDSPPLTLDQIVELLREWGVVGANEPITEKA